MIKFSNYVGVFQKTSEAISRKKARRNTVKNPIPSRQEKSIREENKRNTL